MKIGLCVLAIFVSQFALAKKPTESASPYKILKWAELQKLSREDQVMYLFAVQDALVAAEEAQEKNELYSFKKFISETLLKEAHANTGNLCIFAGFLRNRAADGQCESAGSEGCSNANEYLCSPWVFGRDVCARGSGRRGLLGLTAACQRKSMQRYPDQGEILTVSANQNRAEWDRFVGLLNTHCETKQPRLCEIVKGRVARIASLLPSVQTATTGAPQAQPQPPPQEVRTAPAQSTVQQTQVSAQPPRSQPAPQTQSQVSAPQQNGRPCSVNALVEDIKLPDEAGRPLMGIDEARRIACLGQIDQARMAQHDSAIQRQLSRLGSQQSAESRAYRNQLTVLRNNLAACSARRQVYTPGKGRVVEEPRGGVRFILNDGQNWGSSRLDLARSLNIRNVNLCEVDFPPSIAQPLTAAAPAQSQPQQPAQSREAAR